MSTLNQAFKVDAYTLGVSNTAFAENAPEVPMTSNSYSINVSKDQLPLPQVDVSDSGFGTHVREAISIVKDLLGR